MINIAFEAFWNLYPKRNGKKLLKKDAEKYFINKIKDAEIPLLMQAVQNYVESDTCKRGYARDAIRFLRNDFWRDWLEPETKPMSEMEMLKKSIMEDEDAKRGYQEINITPENFLPEPKALEG